MENKRKVVPTWISVILLLLCIAGVAYFGYTLAMMFPYVGWSTITVSFIIGLISSILVIIYCLTGYKKSSATIFKAYCVAVTISFMLTTYSTVPAVAEGGADYTIVFFAMIIQCGLWFVLTIAKDLGKKKSLSICAIAGLLQLLITIMSARFGVYAVLTPAVGLVNYIIVFIVFYAKYQDKQARGTK